MKGATAEPLVRTINPPKIVMTIKTGRSQNFFRTRRKAQNSRRKLTITASELVLECFRRGSRRGADDPVALRCWFEFKPQRILASEPHQEADGDDAKVEQEAKQKGTY